MAQVASKVQLKENAALLEALRQTYAENKDFNAAKATETILHETTKSLDKANADARELIMSESQMHSLRLSRKLLLVVISHR